jgi:hypothetical protein
MRAGEKLDGVSLPCLSFPSLEQVSKRRLFASDRSSYRHIHPRKQERKIGWDLLLAMLGMIPGSRTGKLTLAAHRFFHLGLLPSIGAIGRYAN